MSMQFLSMFNRLQFALIDTETTGLSPKKDRIVEIAVVTLDSGFSEVNRWHTLVNPGRPIPNSSIHGISDAMVRDAPTFGQVYAELLTQLRGKVLLAHNATFDADMLVAESDRLDDEDVFFPFVDSMRLARQVVPKGTSCSLESLARRTRVMNQGAHSALGDARTTGIVLKKLFGRQRHSIGRSVIKQAIPFTVSPAHLDKHAVMSSAISPRLS
ncbi:3'-5' exonuclease [Corynebacterium dentalis]|uniref:3'-5' exonuclease n=1 Tax=Corynebacterium dentalis TaxID=2014528 RepID=UPI001359F547|nr:3'-5' exonuclease [Corynebacterium dentalis]